jgi:hypothetical protein
MSQTQNPCNQPQTRREIIEEGVGYKVYREYDQGTPIRLVKEYYYKEYEDDLKAEFKIEIAYNNVLVEVTRIIIGKAVGGAVLRDIRLDVEALRRVQDLMLRVKNRQQFDELLHWLITAKYTPKCTAMIENPDPF